MKDILSYLQESLNETQFEAAKHINSSSLILAGAGSGKTRVLTFKIAYLIFGKNINPSNILAVTFTNKAANEMKERILQINEQLTQPDSSDDFDTMMSSAQPRKLNLKWVGTFHSIFLKILKEDIDKLGMKYDKNFGVYDEGESLSVIKGIIKDMKIADKIGEREIKGKISRLKNEGISYQKFLNTLEPSDELIGQIYEKYQKALESSNSLDFDDLLYLPYLLFSKDEEVLTKRKTRFRYIMVDEAQDTNEIQFQLMKMLSGRDGNITFIGDDFQSIYMRRGAVMENFLNISKFWDNVKIFKLEINYRSKPHIVDAGNEVIKNNSKQYQKNIVSHRNGDDKLRLFCFRDETDEALSIINLIKKLREEKNFKWSDFTILYRTNAQSQPFEEVLIAEGMPYKVWGGFKFFERKEIKDIISYLKYIINPKDSVALKRIINTPTRKIGTTTVMSLEEFGNNKGMTLNEIIESIDYIPINVGPSTKNAIKEFVVTIKFVKSQIPTANPGEIINSIVNNIKYKEYLIKQEGPQGAEEKMENIGALINMASKYEEKGIESIAKFLEEVSLLIDMEDKDNQDKDFVNLMSVHASKGLEFKIVFIAGLEETIFPLSGAGRSDAELEEERRLMYVAITRAKDVLFMSHANSRQKRGQTKCNLPSRFIDEIPSDLIKTYDLSSSAAKPKNRNTFSDGDVVKHKLFGKGTIIESYAEMVFVKFWNDKTGPRKIDPRFLEKSES